jgi:hypothetical protein
LEAEVKRPRYPFAAAALAAAIEPDEELRYTTLVVPASYISSGSHPDTPQIGLALAEAGAVPGDAGSLAPSIPRAPSTTVSWMVVTDRRVVLISHDRVAARVGPISDAFLYWEVPVTSVTRVEKRSRLQGARFRMRFVDGSDATFITKRMRDVNALRDAVEAGQPKRP